MKVFCSGQSTKMITRKCRRKHYDFQWEAKFRALWKWTCWRKPEKKPQDFGHKKKIHLHPTLAAGLMEKKKTRHFLLHTWHYIKRCVRTALPLDSQGVLKYVWSWQAMESWSPTSQYDDSLNVLPKIVKFTQESSFTELLTCSSTVTRLTAHRWSVTLWNLQAYRVSPCTENARRKTYSVPNKSYTLELAKIVSPFLWFPVWNKYGWFSFIYILLLLSSELLYKSIHIKHIARILKLYTSLSSE